MLSFQEFLATNTIPKHPYYSLPSNSNGTDWGIADIHGCSKTFQKLLARLQLQTCDRLFLLGDYINKGPDSAGVLNIILQLLQDGFQVWPLRGNHEQMLLDDWDEGNPAFFFATRSKGDTKQYVDRSAYENFLRKLPYYYELEDRVLVHAGLDIAAANPLEAYEDMLWIRGMSERIGYVKQVIHGHEPMYLSFIEDDVRYRAPTINLDNGCVNHRQWGMGSLLALNLTTMALQRQVCIDF